MAVVLTGHDTVLQDVVKSAAKLLTSKFFGGEPKVVNLEQNTQIESERGLISLYETVNGSAVRCSAAFYGLKLYVLRMIEPIWEDNLFKDSPNGKLVQCNWSSKIIEVKTNPYIHAYFGSIEYDQNIYQSLQQLRDI